MPERPPRERSQNRSRARGLLRGGGGVADENRPAARRVAASRRCVRAADDQLGDIRRSAACVETLQTRAVQPQIDRRRNLRRAAPAGGLVATRRVRFPLQVLARRRDANRAESRLDGNAHLVRILSRFVRPRLDTRHAHLEHVLGVERKVVFHRHAGARVEGQVVVQLLVARPLVGIALRVVDLFDRFQREIADGQAADLARGRHVLVEQRRRRRQHRRDVVEPVAGIVDRQPFTGTHIHGKQIADGVAVLGAIQAMHRRAARDSAATAAARSSVVSTNTANASACFASGLERTVDGGISPERSFRATFSQTSACSGRFVTESVWRLRPPVLALSLWHETQ